jgi:glucose/mannose-6-phosphate isomerase
MSMYNAIKQSSIQFAFEPKIENEKNLKKFSKFIIAGMGGSHLAGNVLKLIKPELDIIIHSSYGLPAISKEDLAKTLVILSSYSGNTEETLDAYEEADKLGLDRAAICVGGKLLEKAKKDNVPYVQMEDIKIDGTSIQPRSALTLNLKSLLKIIGEDEILTEITKLKDDFRPETFEENGKDIAKKIKGYTPIIYTSEKNFALAYNWKIKFNETGKIPAFYNVLPELNHNEMTSFDVKEKTHELSERLCFIFLKDKTDHIKIQQRMEITTKLYEDRKLKVFEIDISNNNIFHKIFKTLTIADFAAYFTAESYGLESEQVPMVEEFKKLIEK